MTLELQSELDTLPKQVDRLRANMRLSKLALIELKNIDHHTPVSQDLIVKVGEKAQKSGILASEKELETVDCLRIRIKSEEGTHNVYHIPQIKERCASLLKFIEKNKAGELAKFIEGLVISKGTLYQKGWPQSFGEPNRFRLAKVSVLKRELSLPPVFSALRPFANVFLHELNTQVTFKEFVER